VNTSPVLLVTAPASVVPTEFLEVPARGVNAEKVVVAVNVVLSPLVTVEAGTTMGETVCV
jgi:hypothetical protein